MKKIYFTIVLCLFASACKMNQGSNNDSVSKNIGDLKQDDSRVFTNSEMKIIQETCNNLVAKRNYFNSLDDMKVRFRFQLEASDCNAKVVLTDTLSTVLSNTSSTDLEYYVDRTDYLRNVITDQSPGIKYLCDNANATNLKNTFTESSVTYAYKVFINQGYNRFEIIKSQKGSDGKVVVKSGDGIDFITSSYQAPKNMFGMEKEHLRNLVCDNGKYYFVKQTWLQE